MKPLLLLLPGMLNTPAVWDAVTDALGDAAEVVVLDATTQDSLEAMARDAMALVAPRLAAQPGRRLVACGFSMGGYVLQEALTQGLRPAALAFLSTSARPETEEGRAVRAKTVGAIERDFGKVVQNLAGFVTGESRHGDAAFMDGVRNMMLSTGAATAIRQTQAIAARRDHRELLVQLTMPALVMCGRADRTTPPPLSEELAALLPHARLIGFDGVGHMTPLEAAPQVAAQLRPLL